MIFALVQISSVIFYCPQDICMGKETVFTFSCQTKDSASWCFSLVWQEYPLLAIIGYMLLSGRSSCVVAARHSSRSSSKGWWPFWSTLAMMGMKEPKGKLVDSAGPEKSSRVVKDSVAKQSQSTEHFMQLWTSNPASPWAATLCFSTNLMPYSQIFHRLILSAYIVHLIPRTFAGSYTYHS